MIDNKQLTKQFEIRSTESDLWDRLHVDALFSMMQEAASEHSGALGTGSEVLDPRGMVFLLSGITLRLYAYPYWGDRLMIRTWCREIDRLYFIRDFVIETTEGKLVAKASSSWFLTDKESHRPLRPSVIHDLTCDYIYPEENALGFNPLRLKNGQLDLPDESGFAKFADFSDLDRNRHVNNTRYVAWTLDYFYHRFGIQEEHGIQGIDINFLSEVKYQEKVYLYGMKLDTAILPEAFRSNRVAAVEGRSNDGKALFRSLLHY